jgi:hypothetical protein
MKLTHFIAKFNWRLGFDYKVYGLDVNGDKASGPTNEQPISQ